MPVFSDGSCGYEIRTRISRNNQSSEIIKRKEDFYDTICIQSPTQRKSQRSDGRALRQCHPAVHLPESDRIFPHLCRQHDLHYDSYRTDTYGGKRRDISDGISAFDSHYDFIVDLCRSFSDRHHIILSEYCLRQTCCDCQSVLRLQILIQKIARDLRSTDPAEYGMYTSV